MGWRAGAAAALARTAAVRLLAVLVRNHPVKQMYQVLLPSGLIATMLTALEEEDSRSRLLACETLTVLLKLLDDAMGYQELRAAIPEIMKRLDDSRDIVRLSALDTVVALSY